MIVQLLKVPANVLRFKSNGVFILVGEELSVEGRIIVANSLDKSHLFSLNLIFAN